MAETLASQVSQLFETLAARGNQLVADGWAQVFGTNSYSPQFFLGLAQVTANLDRLEEDVRAASLSDRSKGLYLEAVGKLREYCFFPNVLNLTCNHLAKERETFNRLHMLDDVVPRIEDRDVNRETLGEVRAELAELLAALDEIEMEPRLRAFLKLQVGQLIWAIDMFHVVGLDGLARTYGATYAEIHRALGMKGATEPQVLTWLGRARAAAVKLGKGVIFAGAVAGGLTAIGSTGASAFDLLDGEPEQADCEAPAAPPIADNATIQKV